MRIAYLLYDGLTLLDFTGFYDPVSRLKSGGFLPGLSWDLCALTDSVADGFGLRIGVDRVAPDLADYDMVFVPGGFGSRELVATGADGRLLAPAFVDWLRTAGPVPRKVSVCTGSLLLGAAGFLKGRRATTHFSEYERLAEYGCSVSEDRIVDEGDLLTGGAVASSLDLGLYVCHQLAGATAAERIRRSMHYRFCPAQRK